MRLNKPLFKPLPWFYKILGLGIFACFLVLGIIGLIMPVLPGVVFLFLAFYVLTRISRRIATYAHAKPWFNYHLQHLQAANGLSMSARAKLVALLSLRGILALLDNVWLRLKGVRNN